MMEEPSVLDYLKAKLTPWRGAAIQIPPVATLEEGESEPLGVQETGPSVTVKVKPVSEITPESVSQTIVIPWRSLSAVGLALLAQISLEPGPERTWIFGFGLYLLAATFLFLAYKQREWVAAPVPEVEHCIDSFTIQRYSLIVGAPLAVLAFLSFGGNQFTLLNVSLWVVGFVFLLHAFWLLDRGPRLNFGRLRDIFADSRVRITLSRWTLLTLAAYALVLFFRIYRFNDVPPEMVSDHAEKLLDVWDVLNGQARIYFTRNTGREAMQMYMTAAIIKLLGTGYSFLSLKIGTILAGLLALPFIYLLGKEVGNQRTGLFALIFAGIAYWPNVISRVGLRFPLYPLFVAPTLYFLLRGIRTSNRNDFILSGVFLGIGLHGYTPIRILPFVVVIAVGLYLIHRQSEGVRRQTIFALILLTLISLVIFLPLMRYWLENPDVFSYRTMTRLSTVERPLPGPAWQIFFENLWNALTMFAWDNGEIWLHSVTNRPALGIISGAFFYLGVVLVLFRYLSRRHWIDLFLLLSIPLLMMPSILSLAFPAENPALNRMSGAIIPVFLIVGIALDGLMTTLENSLESSRGRVISWGVALLLVFFSSAQNYNLVFNEYQRDYGHSSWNTSELGEVIRDFSTSLGSPDSAWVVAYPHWVDTRLVGMVAGFPLKDYAIWPEEFESTKSETGAKLFLVKVDDIDGLESLRQLYPQSVIQRYTSKVENHDFWMLFVPPVE